MFGHFTTSCMKGLKFGKSKPKNVLLIATSINGYFRYLFLLIFIALLDPALLDRLSHAITINIEEFCSRPCLNLLSDLGPFSVLTKSTTHHFHRIFSKDQVENSKDPFRRNLSHSWIDFWKSHLMCYQASLTDTGCTT